MRIQEDAALPERQREEARQSIRRVERHYFADDGNGDGRVDLKQIAEDWVNRLAAH